MKYISMDLSNTTIYLGRCITLLFVGAVASRYGIGEMITAMMLFCCAFPLICKNK